MRGLTRFIVAFVGAALVALAYTAGYPRRAGEVDEQYAAQLRSASGAVEQRRLAFFVDSVSIARWLTASAQPLQRAGLIAVRTRGDAALFAAELVGLAECGDASVAHEAVLALAEGLDQTRDREFVLLELQTVIEGLHRVEQRGDLDEISAQELSRTISALELGYASRE